jgi:hypothetical protein
MRRARVHAFALSFLLVVSVLAGAAFVAGPAFARGKPLPAPNLRPELVVPGPGDDPAIGSFTYKVGRDGFHFAISVSNLSGLIQTIVVRRGVAGTTGPVVVRLSPSPIGIHGLNGTVPISSTLQREIGRTPEAFYLQIETTTHPSGALRGQLR